MYSFNNYVLRARSKKKKKTIRYAWKLQVALWCAEYYNQIWN